MQRVESSASACGSSRRMALWMASPPTCSVRTPRASLTAMDDFDFFMGKGKHAEAGHERERCGDEDRHVIAAECIEGDTGKPGTDQRAKSGAGIERADDAGHRARAVEVHNERRHERHVAAIAD